MPAATFRILGVPVEIRASFLILAVVLGLQRHTDSMLLTWLGIATLAVLVHEAGHAVAFRSFGIAPRVILHGGGGVTIGGDPGVHRRIILSGAGPLAGLLLGVVAVLAARALPAGPTTRALIDDVLFATLGWSLINLLPVGDLDGHAVMKDIVRVTLGHPAVTEIRAIGLGIIVALVAGAIWFGAYDAAFIIGFIAIMSASSLSTITGLQWRSGRAATGTLLINGRNDEALQAADAALARNPDDTDALLEKATALRLMTRYEESEAAYSQVLALKPGLVSALSGRAMVRSAVGQDTEARADLEAMDGEAGSSPDGDLGRVIALYVSHRYEEAASVIEAGLARPDRDRAERSRLEAMRPLINEALGHAEIALQQIDSALRDRPDDFVLHEIRALVLIALARPGDAMRSARRALEVAPRNPELLETMGITERFAGRADSGLPRLLAAAAARPELPRGRAELSACFTQLDRFEEARTALETLPESAHRDPSVQYAEACLLGATGERSAAVDRLAEAIRTRPGLGRRAAADPVLGWIVEEPNAARIVSLPPGEASAQAS